MKILTTFLTGLIFGLGIVASGMANPAKVLNFFDVAGSWDASLGLVMVSALIVAAIGYRFVFKKPAPMFEPKFYVPTGGVIDRKLVTGSLVFGIGWAISGFCPGGALPALGTGSSDVLIFTAALIGGMMSVRFVRAQLARQQSTVANAAT